MSLRSPEGNKPGLRIGRGTFLGGLMAAVGGVLVHSSPAAAIFRPEGAVYSFVLQKGSNEISTYAGLLELYLPAGPEDLSVGNMILALSGGVSRGEEVHLIAKGIDPRLFWRNSLVADVNLYRRFSNLGIDMWINTVCVNSPVPGSTQDVSFNTARVSGITEVKEITGSHVLEAGWDRNEFSGCTLDGNVVNNIPSGLPD